MSAERAAFQTADYLVLVTMLMVSVLIGVYYAWKDRHSNDVENYLIGRGQMSPIPVAISLCVSYVSGIMMVGVPTQLYYFGMVLIIWVFIAVTGPVITAIYYIPVFFRLKIDSVYQVLEIRYGEISRKVASMSIILLMVLYMGLVTFIPCLALNAVTGISMTTSIILTCAICTLYTTLGGIKGVIWTDVVQAGVMILGMVLLIIKTTPHIGGFSSVGVAMRQGKRLNFFNWDPNPYVKHTTWNLTFGGMIIWITMSAINQPMVQRYLSCKNVRQAQAAAMLMYIPQLMFMLLSTLAGLVMYTYFSQCDPVLSKKIKLKDQALLYMAVTVFHDTPGLAGLFVSAIYSGTLSTISSGINALASVFLNDYLIPRKPTLKKQALKITKFLVVVFGILVLLATFVVAAMGSLVVEILLAAFGSIGGPLLGVYTMGLFMPWTNQKGAVTGQLIATVLTLWISIGQAVYPVRFKYLNIRPITVAGCAKKALPVVATMANTLVNTTLIQPYNSTSITDYEYSSTDYGNAELQTTVLTTNFTTLPPAPIMPPMPPPRPAIADWLYGISVNYIGLIGFLVAIIIGLIISGITGFEDPAKANTLIFTPLMDNKLLPEKLRKFLRFGVPEMQLEELSDKLMDDEDEEAKNNNNVRITNEYKGHPDETTKNGMRYSAIQTDDITETII